MNRMWSCEECLKSFSWDDIYYDLGEGVCNCIPCVECHKLLEAKEW